MCVVRRGRDSGGYVFLGEAETVADVCFYERQRQWRMCVFRRGRDSAGCVLLGEAETVADMCF
jgi:hypothetical protein